MRTLDSKYRLHSSALERPDNDLAVEPKRVIFLSVEGSETEIDYFSNLNRHLDAAVVRIEVLRRRRKDGTSAPDQVLDLLNEYISVRENGIIPKLLPSAIAAKYSAKDIDNAINDSGALNHQMRMQIKADLEKAGIDVEYRRYLHRLQTDADFFGIVIDRDHISNSREKIEECTNKCAQNGYGCYISNPCFEFWLLLHLCDVNSEFDEAGKALLADNKHVSNRHTVTSAEVSDRAGHGKHISASKFDKKYYPNIPKAIERAKDFFTEFPDLLDGLGTNIPDLLHEIEYVE